MQFDKFASLVLLFCLPSFSAAQQSEKTYSRRNTFSGFVEYSNDSSHIIMGSAINRKIGALGFQYQRRLLHRRTFDLFYEAEIRPGMLESDPVQTDVGHQIAPPPTTSPFTFVIGPVLKCSAGAGPTQTATQDGVTYVYYRETICTRQTVTEQGFAPAGIRINVLPRHALQLTFSSNAGYMFSTHPEPVTSAGSFNYTFDFGGGLEFYRTRNQSVRLEYQVQHFSNKATAYENPGVDSGFVKLTYTFGR